MTDEDQDDQRRVETAVSTLISDWFWSVVLNK